MIYIIIPVFNRWNYTKACLESLKIQSYLNFQTIVVDHGSTDGTSDNIKKEFPEVIVLQGDENMWWTAATNLGIKKVLEISQSENDYILTLNNDLTVEKSYLEELVKIAQEKQKCIVGSVSINSKNHDQVVYAGTKWNKWSAKFKRATNLNEVNILAKSQNWIACDLLPGRGTLIPIEAFKQLGLFDETNFPHYAADEDYSNLCKNAGFQVGIATKALVYSEIEAMGLKNIHKKRGRNYWKDLFTSIRSPVNLKTRWRWAKKNAPIPLLYFFIDFSRILVSQLKQKT